MLENGKKRQAERHIFTVAKTATKLLHLLLKKLVMKLIYLSTNNITTTPLDVPEASDSSNIPNTTVKAFNIDLDTPIPSSSRSSLFSLCSKKEKTLKIEARLAEFKGYVKCELPTLCVISELFPISPTTCLTSSENCKKSKVEVIQKSIVFLQNDLLAKHQIIKSILETQTAILDKISEQ